MFHIFGNVNCTTKLYQRRNNITIHRYLARQEELGSYKTNHDSMCFFVIIFQNLSHNKNGTLGANTKNASKFL
jgi:hypothetical protein